MKSYLRLLIISLVSISTLSFATDSTNNGENTSTVITSADIPLYSKVFDPARDPFKDVQAAFALAKATNRNVLIKVGGNWCGWCMAMNRFWNNNDTVFQALHSNFVVLKVNDSDVNENKEFLKNLPPLMGYPHIFITSSSGKVLLSKDTAELLNDKADGYSQARWLTFIDKWQFAKTDKIQG